MATSEVPKTDVEKTGGDVVPEPGVRSDDIVTSGGEDILALQDLDPALNMKMHLVNNVG
jgi:hypothetical protein